MFQSLGLKIGLSITVACLLLSDLHGGETVIQHEAYEDFIQGSLGDGGARTYISRRGRIQVVPRWDLNQDGYMDVVFNQDHNPVENVDAFIYWGSSQGYHSLFPPFWEEVLPAYKLFTALIRNRRHITFLPTFGGGPVRIADLNRDGYPDIFFANTIHNYTVHMEAYIYWGGPEGYSVLKRQTLPTLFGRELEVADLNRDGWLDIVVANFGEESGDRQGYRLHRESYIYWGAPSGFSIAQRTSIATLSALSCTVGDFNGDGWADLAFANNNLEHQSLCLYWGAREGFSDERRLQLEGGNPRLVRAADLDRDGKDDLIVFSSQSRSAFFDVDQTEIMEVDPAAAGIRLFYGSAEFDFNEPILLPGKSVREMVAKDVNDDQYVDLILASQVVDDESGVKCSEIYWGSSSGFDSERRTLLPTLSPGAVVAEDLNRDGYLDLVFANSEGPKTHDPPSYIYWGSDDGFHAARRSHLQGFGAVGVAARDLNRDGYPDVVLMNQLSGKKKGEISSLIFWGNSAHYYSEANTTLIPAPAKPYFSKIADFNDDGYPDMVFSGVSPFLLWGGPDGFEQEYRFDLDARATGIDVADYDLDGYLDVIFLVISRNPKVHHYGLIFLGWKDGFSVDRTVRVSPQAYKSLYMASADLDKNGFLDLIFAGTETSDQLSEIMWGSRSGYGRRPSTLLRTNWVNVPAVADLDQNGWLDIIFPGRMDAITQSSHTKSLIMWGSEKGFSDENRTELEAFGAAVIRVSDLNRDGFLDLVSSNYKTEQTRSLPVFVYWGNAEHHYGQYQRTELPAESACGIQLLDLNQDQYPEIIVNNHIKDGDHNFGAYVYWGGEEGYSIHRRTHLPTAGTHFAHGIVPGNIYDRSPEYDYFSTVVQVPFGKCFLMLDWRGETPHNTAIRFQVRSGSGEKALTGAGWEDITPRQCFSLPQDSAFMQYRVILVSPDGGNSPILERVSLHFSDSCLR